MTATVVPGNPGVTSGGVTLDADGSVDPGQSSTAAALLWGAATDDGPFSQLDRAVRGDVVSLRQPSDTTAATGECVQRWLIIRIFEPSAVPERKEPALLRLAGFDAGGERGLTVLFYVDAVPDPTTR